MRIDEDCVRWTSHRLIRPYVTQLASADHTGLMLPDGMNSRGIMLASARERIKTQSRVVSFLDVRVNRESNRIIAEKLGIDSSNIEFFTPAKLRMMFPEVRNELAKTEMFVMLQAIGHRRTQSREMFKYMVRHFPYLHFCLHMHDLEKFVDLLPRNPVYVMPPKGSSYFFPIFGDPNKFGYYGYRSRAR